MTTADILKKVRELEIISKKNATHFFSGDYRSSFKGRGMNFREVRDYTPGDDVRFIDWNVSARYAHPFTKIFEEERELNVMLLVDVSASALFGSQVQKKRDYITQIGALLAFNAIRNNDKVGVIFFSDVVEKYIAPAKGRNHALYIVRELLTLTPKRNKTNLSEALKYLQVNIPSRCVVFILSDFFDDQFDKMLQVVARKHDVIGLKINDSLESNLPEIGVLQVNDMESGSTQLLDTNNPMVRHQYRQQFHARHQQCVSIFQRSGADLVQFYTQDDYIKKLKQFFYQRLRKRK